MSPVPLTRTGTQTAAPEGTGQDGTRSDGTDRTRGRGGRRRERRRARAPHAPGSARRARPSCHLAASDRVRADRRAGGRSKCTRTPGPPGSCLSPALASLAPLPTSPSSHSRLSSAATWASRDTRLPRHVTLERPRGAGSRLFSPPAGSLTPSAPAQWAPSPLFPGQDVIAFFVPENGTERRGFFASVSLS